MDGAEKALKIALEKGADEVSAKEIVKDDVQIRFSNNGIDIMNRWKATDLAVFIAVNGRTTGVEIKNHAHMEETIEKAIRFARNLPENPEFLGLYDRKTVVRREAGKNLEIDDLAGIARDAMDAALEHDVKRISGEIKLTKRVVSIATNYNLLSEIREALSCTVRAFNDEGMPGQASTHVADRENYEKYGPGFVGDKAGRLADMNRRAADGEEGKFTILFDPLCFGSGITEVGRSLSAFSVQMGTSFFVDALGKQVSSEVLTLRDDPHRPGINSAGFDDEGAPTGKSLAIENGVLKTYLHSHSTAKKFETETTGNAADMGSMANIAPQFWQMSVEPGKRSWEDMLGEIDRGLYIANTWYTRYQDRRAGDFSTIPRDGIFYIENGEIVRPWKGIRITENMLNLMKNIRELGNEVMPVDWWGETHAVFAPHALIDDVRITKAR